MNKKEYQYLLLKVIGNNHFSIAPKFNFSSLKKTYSHDEQNENRPHAHCEISFYSAIGGSIAHCIP
jgi:hypothetical protein